MTFLSLQIREMSTTCGVACIVNSSCFDSSD